jgi:hypothetical protein
MDSKQLAVFLIICALLQLIQMHRCVRPLNAGGISGCERPLEGRSKQVNGTTEKVRAVCSPLYT